MAHFAKINSDSIVETVIVISNADCDSLPFPESEPVGQAFIADVLQLDGEWLQTSYNNNFRGTYAGNGFSYDATLDEFVAPPPLPWMLPA